VGPLVALIAAWFVARQSRRLSPLEGIQGVEPAGLERYPLRALLLSLAAWIVAVACLTAVAANALSVAWALPAGLVKDKQKITVRFQATQHNEIAAVFGLRTIRAAPAH